MKAGANYRDKLQVVKMYTDEQKPHTPEQIASKLRLKPEHVRAICDQVDDGNMRLNPGSEAPSKEEDESEED